MDMGDVVMLKLSGNVVFEDVPTLQTALHRITNQGKNQILIDCKDMDSLNSTALATFLSTYKRVRGGSIAFVNLSPHVERVFRETHLDQFFRLCPTVEDAMAGFSRI
jgi:anti-sigma B factor antagonist